MLAFSKTLYLGEAHRKKNQHGRDITKQGQNIILHKYSEARNDHGVELQYVVGYFILLKSTSLTGFNIVIR